MRPSRPGVDLLGGRVGVQNTLHIIILSVARLICSLFIPEMTNLLSTSGTYFTQPELKLLHVAVHVAALAIGGGNLGEVLM